MSVASNKDSDLNRYREYLRVLAEMQLNPRLRVKEDVSDITSDLKYDHENLKEDLDEKVCSVRELCQ